MAVESICMFPKFSDLPPELRISIWEATLPRIPEQGVFFFKKESWQPINVPENAEQLPRWTLEIDYGFRHELLDPIKWDFPLAVVNREARSIAVSWARKQGLEIRYPIGRTCPSLDRVFNPSQDILYVTTATWWDFVRDIQERSYELDIADQMLGSEGTIHQLAIPESFLREGWEIIQALVNGDCITDEILTVRGEAPKIHINDEINMDLQRRLKLETTSGRKLSWNHDYDDFDVIETGGPDDEELLRELEKEGNFQLQGFFEGVFGVFKITSVAAVFI